MVSSALFDKFRTLVYFACRKKRAVFLKHKTSTENGEHYGSIIYSNHDSHLP